MPNKQLLSLLLFITILSSCNISKMRYSRGLNIRLSERFRHSDDESSNKSADGNKKTGYWFRAVSAFPNKDSLQLKDAESAPYVSQKQSDKPTGHALLQSAELSEPAQINHSSKSRFNNRERQSGMKKTSKASPSQTASALIDHSASASGNRATPSLGDETLLQFNYDYRTINALGLSSFLLLFAAFFPLSLLLGAMALRQFRRNPETYKLKLLAILGTFFGYLGSFLIALLLLGFSPHTWLFIPILIIIIVSTIILIF